MKSIVARIGHAGRSALIVAAISVAAPIVASPTVHAATYDGQKASSTSCWNDRRIVSSTHLYAGSYQDQSIIDLYYSPSCRTAWGRIEHGSIASPGDNNGGVAEVTRNSDRRTYSCRVVDSSGSCYTAMVNDANVTSYAYGEEDTGAYIASGRTANY
ncbi:DUF2690 domain-containing protein [Streptomyces sp. NPDC046985]|uniref:DUF2690 domain-containing protein n=1 Tax=Streptomyces sp. NPDC046985 TaxID=3155377 RepID=UPI00340CC634